MGGCCTVYRGGPWVQRSKSWSPTAGSVIKIAVFDHGFDLDSRGQRSRLSGLTAAVWTATVRLDSRGLDRGCSGLWMGGAGLLFGHEPNETSLFDLQDATGDMAGEGDARGSSDCHSRGPSGAVHVGALRTTKVRGDSDDTVSRFTAELLD